MISREFPNLPTHPGKAEKRQHGSLQGAEPFGRLCALSISHLLIKTANGRDPDMIRTGLL